MVKIQTINKSFNIGKNNEISVLKDVSLSFPNTGLFVILGPSGSGKSTLLSLLGALDKPDSGEILVNGEDITKYSDKEQNAYRQKLVSFVFQDDNLVDYLSLKDNALLKDSSRDHSKVNALLKKLNIDGLENKKPSTLSGGEKQRCAIARALLSDAQILLCDEPTASLDSNNARLVLELLKEISESKLVIVVSHDEELCREFTNSIIHLHDGMVQNKEDTSFDNNQEIVSVNKEFNKTYRSRLFHKAFHHAKHKIKETSLIAAFALIAFFCVTIIIGLSSGTKDMVDNAVNELIHYSPLTVSSYYNDITGIGLITPAKENYNSGINIDQKTSIVSSFHKNVITEDFVNYLTADPKENTYFSFNNDQSYSIIYQENNGTYRLFDSQSVTSLNDYVETFFGKKSPINELIYDQDYFNQKYHWLDGSFPKNDNEAILVYTKHSSVSEDVATLLNLKEGDDIRTALGKKIYIADHDKLYGFNRSLEVTGRFLKDYETLKQEGRDIREVNNDFIEYVNEYYEGNVEGQKAVQASINSLFKEEVETRTLKAYSKIQNSSILKQMVDDEEADTIVITGIAEIPEKAMFSEKNTGILISNNKLKAIRERNSQSSIAKEIDSHVVLMESSSSINVPHLFGYINNVSDYSNESIESFLLSYIDFFENRKFFSTNNEISSIEIYAPNLDVKNYYIEKIEEYNKGVDKHYQMKYLDLSNQVVNYYNSYYSIVEKVLYAISIITLVVSGVLSAAVTINMIASRVKEIGILRACGYSRGYIFTLLESESVTIGFISGVIGVLLANVFAPIICRIIDNKKVDIKLGNLIRVTPTWSLIIIALSLLVAFIATLIPALVYSKKKTVDILKG